MKLFFESDLCDVTEYGLRAECQAQAEHMEIKGIESLEFLYQEQGLESFEPPTKLRISKTEAGYLVSENG